MLAWADGHSFAYCRTSVHNKFREIFLPALIILHRTSIHHPQSGNQRKSIHQYATRGIEIVALECVDMMTLTELLTMPARKITIGTLRTGVKWRDWLTTGELRLITSKCCRRQHFVRRRSSGWMVFDENGETISDMRQIPRHRRRRK